MSTTRILAAFLLCVAAVGANSDKTALRKAWASGYYATNSIPAAWRPAHIPATETNVTAYEHFSLRHESLLITNFIARYGLPNRYLTTQKTGRENFLVYDLPSGHAVALYVTKPPDDRFGACVIITSDGSLVSLIK